MGGDLPGTWNHQIPCLVSLSPANPDPTQNVMWGEQTWEEMMIGAPSTSTSPASRMEPTNDRLNDRLIG